MKTLILILLSFSLSGQIPDNVKHHYAGVIITDVTGVITYKVTKNRFLSVVTGLACGIVSGIVKEEWYDRTLGKGVPSDLDKLNTGWGSCVGAVYLAVGLHIHNKKQIDTTQFKNYGTP